MAAQARIVLFPWVWTPLAARLDSPTPGPSNQATRPPRRRNGVEPRRGDAGVVGWRVIGANNRELGRGARPSRGVDEALQAVQRAQLTIGGQVGRVAMIACGGWLWRLSLDEDTVAVSGRGYHRQRECEYSLEQFRAFFPTAGVAIHPSPDSSRRAVEHSPSQPSGAHVPVCAPRPG
jgi:hypothetical protein